MSQALMADAIARMLYEMRERVVTAVARAFPQLPREDLEDAYSRLLDETYAQLLEGMARVPSEAEKLQAWAERALRNDACDITRSARVRTNRPLGSLMGENEDGDGSDLSDHTPVLADSAAVFETPEDAAAAGELHAILSEFFAELPESDRQIARWHIDPSYDKSPREIARALQLPIAEVRRALVRADYRLARFKVHFVDPRGLCDRRRSDVVSWLESGRQEMSVALRVHLRRCHACRAELRATTERLHSAILPLVPAGALPVAGVGILERTHEAAATHPVDRARQRRSVARAQDHPGRRDRRWRRRADGEGDRGGHRRRRRRSRAGHPPHLAASRTALRAARALPAGDLQRRRPPLKLATLGRRSGVVAAHDSFPNEV
jgi:RNA polymerase sigma factor (sigma-70 family)